MPTPPKETIGGRKGHHVVAFEFAQKQFEYVTEMESFKETSDYDEMLELEKSQFDTELEQQNFAYETLRLRVEDY